MNKAHEIDSPDKITVSAGPEAGVASPTAISTAACKVNEHCVGDHWTVGDVKLLARLIAIIAMGQAKHAARIIADLQPTILAIGRTPNPQACCLVYPFLLAGRVANVVEIAEQRAPGM